MTTALGVAPAGEALAVVPLAGEGPDELRRLLERRIAALRTSPDDEPLGGALPSETPAGCGLRAAAIAGGVRELELELERIGAWLDEGDSAAPVRATGRALLTRVRRPRVGLLFPGQGSPVHTDAGALGELLPEAAAAHSTAGLETREGDVPAAAVQLAVVASSFAALRAVRAVGIEASFTLGHSLGELLALHWAGCFDERTLFELARARGKAMAEATSAPGAMASIVGKGAALDGLVRGPRLALACENSPTQVVVSGELDAVERCLAEARQRGLRATRLRVTGAFHSPLMAGAATAFGPALDRAAIRPPRRRMLSSVTGGWLGPGIDVRGLLLEQLTSPVRFLDAAREAALQADVMVEAGPGRALSALADQCAGLPCVAVEAGSGSAAGALRLRALAWLCGAAADRPEGSGG